MDIINLANANTLTRANLADGDKLIVRDVSVAQESDPGGLATVTVSELAGSKQTALTGADAGTLVIPLVSGTYFLTKATAGAYTLAAPTAAIEGTRITVVAGTNAAHTITSAGPSYHDGTTGAHTTGTFAAFLGASVTFEARGVLWYQISANAVTWA